MRANVYSVLFLLLYIKSNRNKAILLYATKNKCYVQYHAHGSEFKISELPFVHSNLLMFNLKYSIFICTCRLIENPLNRFSKRMYDELGKLKN